MDHVLLGTRLDLLRLHPRGHHLSVGHREVQGGAVDAPAFLLAALVQEKWLRVLKGKKRGVDAVDSAAFQTKIKRLTGTARKSPTEKKPPVKRKAPVRKKK